MQSNDLFPVTELCRQHQIEITFIRELQACGLVNIETVEETEYIRAEGLTETERFIRLHNELAINMEGLEAISHLLHKVEYLQHKVQDLHNRLRLYEDEI